MAGSGEGGADCPDRLDCDRPALWITAEGEINAYGGPVLDKARELLGIIGGRWCSIGTGEAEAIRPLLALPVWLVRKYLPGAEG